MKARLEFHEKLVSALGAPYVYFQPPESIQMYRGNRIIYTRDEIPYTAADNTKYSGHTKYSVTLVSKDPDWSLVRELPFLFKYCRHDRHYVADNINHDVYIIYY